VKKVMGKKWVLPTFLREIVSPKPWKKMFVILKSYGWPMYVALWSVALMSFMNYVGFLFIPIVAIDNNLTLSQIAILFAVMILPYIINVFIWGVGDKFSKKVLITILVFISAIIYILLGCYNSFLAIILLSFLNSLMVALLSPITSALVTWYARKKDTGMMWWLQEFVSRIGEIIWSLWFWTFAVLVGMNNAFILLWIAFIILSWYLFTKKMINRKNKDYEAIKEKLAKIQFFDK
jgi:sugar phosphate permease